MSCLSLLRIAFTHYKHGMRFLKDDELKAAIEALFGDQAVDQMY